MMEFEYFSEGNNWDIDNEFAFVYVYLPICVHSFYCFQTAIKDDLEVGLNGEYLTSVASELVRQGNDTRLS